MAITKNAYERYRILDRCFRKGEYQIQQLMEICNRELGYDDKGISRRTVYYDIDYMKYGPWEAPIEPRKEGNRRYYTYTDKSFSIENMPITEDQLKQIQSAIDLLRNFNGLPNLNGLSESLENTGLMVMNAKSKPCVGFEENEFVEGRQHLTPLFNAIQNETVLKITYEPFGEEAVSYCFHPQFLKQYNNRWYILGAAEGHEEQVWNLALDRIKSIENTTRPYKEMDVDWTEHFEDVIGVTNVKEAPVEEVHFEVHGKTAHYIHTKPLHQSQRAHWLDPDTLDVKLNVKINYELKRILLSYAANITILAPQSLVEEHKETLKKALSQYQ